MRTVDSHDGHALPQQRLDDRWIAAGRRRHGDHDSNQAGLGSRAQRIVGELIQAVTVRCQWRMEGRVFDGCVRVAQAIENADHGVDRGRDMPLHDAK